MPAAVTVLLALPWLWPAASGPSPNMLPLLVTWACLLLAAPLVASTPRAGEVLQRAVPASWLAAALLSALIGLAQWFGVAPSVDLVSAARIGEAYGNLRQRNHFASLTSLGLLAGVFWPGRGRAWRLCAVLLLAAANAASGSRTGLLQWLLVTGMAALWAGPRRERLAICLSGLGAYGVASALLPILLLEWRGVEAATALQRAFGNLGCSSRRVLWGNVAELVAQRPWTGWGIGELDYAHYMHLYGGERFCDILDNAHNLPLHVAVEAGLPAAVLLMVLAGLAVWRGRPWDEADPLRQLAWAALAMVGVHSLLEYPLWYGPFQAASLAALLLLLPWRLPRPGPLAGTALSLAAGGLLAWFYVTYDLVSDAYRPPDQRRPWTRADPVSAIGEPWPFATQMRFARLALMPLTRANAAEVHALALEMLHYSPEPAVVEKVIESALLLGRDEQALLHAARFRAAFPEAYANFLRQRDATVAPPPGPGGEPRPQPPHVPASPR